MIPDAPRLCLRDCPATEELTAFRLGDLPLSRLEAVAAHLDRCEDCSSRVRLAEDRPNPLVAGLRRPAAPEPYLHEPECARLARRARAIPLEPATGAPSPGPLPPRLGQYELLERIGQGGMGTVYRARHALLDKVVALKVLPDGRLADPLAVARFRREIKALGALDHPHVIRATDAGEADGHHFLVMEYVDGLDLARVVRAAGPLAVADACEVARQAALGLQYAHERRLVHRDIKPSNLMLTPRGEVKILDLGLALLCGENSVQSELTASGQFMGTPRFVAPEQAVAAHDVDIRADLYSLGCALVKLLTGEAPPAAPRPFLGPPQTMPAGAGEVGPDLPEGLRAVLEKLLAEDRADRYDLPAQASEALAPFAHGSDLPRLFRLARAAAGTPGLPSSPRAAADTSSDLARATTSSSAGGQRTPVRSGPARKRRRWPLVVAALLLAAGAAAALFWGLRGGTDLPPPPPAPVVAKAPALRPVLLDWPKTPLETHWHLDAQGKIWMHTADKALLTLGHTEEDEYTFAVDVWPHVTRHLASMGVFFGYHDEPSGRSVVKKYQALGLFLSPGDKGPVWNLKRTVATLENPHSGRTNVVYHVNAAPPGTKAKRLALTVRGGRLVRVTWDGSVIPGFADPSDRKPLYTTPRTDYRGAFGVYISHSSGVFENPVYSRQER